MSEHLEPTMTEILSSYANRPEPTYGHCTHCGAVEVALYQVDGWEDLSHIGEGYHYHPCGYGCEVCS